MEKYFKAKRSDTNTRKVLAIVLNLTGYAVMVAPFLLLINDLVKE